MINTVKIQGEGYLVNGINNVPATEDNRHYRAVQEWIAEGNTPEPADPLPPPPTDEERIDSAFPQTDTARVIFEALFELSNQVRVLQGNPEITIPQLRAWLKAKLP